MSDARQQELPHDREHVARQGRRFQVNARAFDRSPEHVIAQRERTNATADDVARVGLGIATYLAGSVVRERPFGSRGRLSLAVLELWEPFPSPHEESLVLALSLATLVAATTHDLAGESSRRFDTRAMLAMRLAVAADNAGDVWRQWWEDSVQLGEATEFDLGGVNGNAHFWQRIEEADLGSLTSDWLRDVPPPDDAAFARMQSALESAHPALRSVLADEKRDEAATATGFRLSAPPLDTHPPLAPDAPRRRVWFATNRARTTGPAGLTFSGDDATTTSFGICDIELPAGPKDTPPTSTSELGFAGMHLADDEQDFVRQMRDHLTVSTEPRRLLLFIHGYNTPFTSSALQAAQLAYDLDISGDVALFSWPSAGKWYLYGRDAQRVDLGIPVLTRFLVLLGEEIGYERIDVIVHSLGNRLFATAAELASAQATLPIGSVFLAAADLYFGRFHQVAPTIAALSPDPVTLYVSRKDRALLASKWTFNQDPRVGRGNPIAIAERFHTIDASDVRAGDFLRHQYYANTHTLLADMAAQMHGALVPQKRGDKLVKTQTPKGETYWRFRRSS